MTHLVSICTANGLNRAGPASRAINDIASELARMDSPGKMTAYLSDLATMAITMRAELCNLTACNADMANAPSVPSTATPDGLPDTTGAAGHDGPPASPTAKMASEATEEAIGAHRKRRRCEIRHILGKRIDGVWTGGPGYHSVESSSRFSQILDDADDLFGDGSLGSDSEPDAEAPAYSQQGEATDTSMDNDAHDFLAPSRLWRAKRSKSSTELGS